MRRAFYAPSVLCVDRFMRRSFMRRSFMRRSIEKNRFWPGGKHRAGKRAVVCACVMRAQREARHRAQATQAYCRCITSSITALPPLSTEMTLCIGAYPLCVMSIT